MTKLLILPVTVFITIGGISQNVGIGTSNPSAQLHTTGTVKHAVLSGTGTRPVFADSSGNLVATLPAPPPSSVDKFPNQSIPDFNCTGISSVNTLSNLPTPVQSGSISVGVGITHPRLADLSIYLITPTGVIINLIDPSAGLTGGDINATFTDEGVLLSTGAAPYTGKFKPYGTLAATVCGVTPTSATFAAIGGGSINPNGSWTLKVVDNTAGNTGTLNRFSISVVTGQALDGVWNLKGNKGTNAFNFIGTTDASPLQFKINNNLVGYLKGTDVYWGLESGNRNSTGFDNIGIGYRALYTNSTGQENVAIGNQVLYANTTGLNNTAVGRQSLSFNTSGNGNVATGAFALGFNSTGSFNVAIGDRALQLNSNRSHLVAIGDSALFTNGQGLNDPNFAIENTAVGSKSLYANTSGYSNTAHGFNTLYSNNSGFSNTATGAGALYLNTTGSHNTGAGFHALNSNNSGDNNTANGSQALATNSTGSLNTATGFKSLFANIAGTGNTANGANTLSANTGSYNTATGLNALKSNNTGANNTATGAAALEFNTTGVYNTAHGMYSMYLNAGGQQNTASGYAALYSNVSGSYNTATGAGALNNNTGSWNTAEGAYAMYQNTTGNQNTAMGFEALYTAGSNNTAVGYQAMKGSSGGQNTALGHQALQFNTTGSNNTAVGVQALWTNGTSTYNTALGYWADASSGVINATALGASAVVNASNKVRIGNNAVTVVESNAGFWTTSDGRFKNNIKEDIKGLEFIKLLRPVSYNFDVDKFDDFQVQTYPDSMKAKRRAMMDRTNNKKLLQARQSGFVAQEVAEAILKSGYNFNGVHAPENPGDNWSISYEKLVVPLVKAVQEQQSIIESQQKQIDTLKKLVDGFILVKK